MSPKRRNGTSAKRQVRAPVFAALGDETRLALVAKLSDGRSHSIAQLTEGSTLTRQAITKHLRVLENVGLVYGVRTGRENLFELDPHPLVDLKTYLDAVSAHWDRALERLAAFVEE